MFDAVRKNPRIAQVVVVLITLPFAFFGMESYFNDSPQTNEVAKVAGVSISAGELQRAVREQQERLRERLGPQVDRALLESPQLRRNVLDNLINQRLLVQYAKEHRLSVPVQTLQESIAAIPAFQGENGFSMARYESALRAQGMNQPMFEASMRQDLAMQQVVRVVGEAGIGPRDAARRLLAAQMETRKIRTASFSPEHYLKEVKLGDGAARSYYEQHAAEFERPARIKVEYLVFSPETLGARNTVTDEAVAAWYESNKARFTVPEERRARHLLLTLEEGADQARVEAVRKEAERLQAELQKNPDQFAELATKHSQDPGSAASGGDLGFFARGVMVPAFEEAAFSLKENEIGAPVRSDFGYHIIQVTAVRPGKTKPLADVRDEIATQLRREAAQRVFAEKADEFGNMVYEQVDKLDEVAKSFGLDVARTDWIDRQSGSIAGYTAPALLDKLFGADAIKSGHNSEAVEVATSVLMAGRVVEHEPATRLAFEEVKPAVETRLIQEEAARLAVAAGEEALRSLQAGQTLPLTWVEHQVRRNAVQPDAALVGEVFKLGASGLPVYAGVRSASGAYLIAALDEVQNALPPMDDPQMKAGLEQFDALLGAQDLEALIASLRKRYDVVVRAAAVEALSQQQ